MITPALVGLMRTATPLLATYATAALTNLSAANDAIKVTDTQSKHMRP